MSEITVTSKSIKANGSDAATAGLTLLILSGVMVYFKIYMFVFIPLAILGALIVWAGMRVYDTGLDAEFKATYKAMHDSTKTTVKERIDPTF